MSTPICVGLGEQYISKDAGEVLVAYGLGSCVAVGMVDPVRHISGLIHCVLPEALNGADPYSAKFVECGLDSLLQGMVRAGADPNRIVVKMAGGAAMLAPHLRNGALDIGPRNIQAARRVLERLRLRLSGEQVGGNTGRTVRLYVAEGRMTVRIVGGKEQDF